MKTIDLFCASPASTAICSSMDQRAMVRHGSRPIDRRMGGRRTTGAPPVPCPSPLPIDSKPYYQRSRSEVVRRKNSADTNFNGGTSPVGSSRYLLSDHKPFKDFLSDSSDHVSALKAASQTVTLPPRPRRCLSSNDSPVICSSSTLSRPRDQVVELRVSIHCKGCEGKVRKHISRMEGVTSYNIDLDTKKVTVIGDVTPLGVLTSISRVKSAQFWSSPTSLSSSSSPMFGLP